VRGGADGAQRVGHCAGARQLRVELGGEHACEEEERRGGEAVATRQRESTPPGAKDAAPHARLGVGDAEAQDAQEQVGSNSGRRGGLLEVRGAQLPQAGSGSRLADGRVCVQEEGGGALGSKLEEGGGELAAHARRPPPAGRRDGDRAEGRQREDGGGSGVGVGDGRGGRRCARGA